VANAASTSVSVLLGNGDGTFQAGRLFGAGTYPRSVAVGDFNGDGKPDLVVSNYLSGNVSVLINNTAR
jgi:VCBS repeat protein